MENISIFITSKNGEKLLPMCVEQIRQCYPNIKIRVGNDRSDYQWYLERDRIAYNYRLDDRSEEVCSELGIECINVDKSEPWNSWPVDNVVQYCWNYLIEDYVILIDNDTFFIQPGIIEFALQKFDENLNLGIIGELLTDFHPFNITRYNEQRDGTEYEDEKFKTFEEFGKSVTVIDNIPKVSNWMTILNMKLLRSKNITYGINSESDSKIVANYVGRYRTKYKVKNSFDGSIIFLKCLNHNVDILDLYSEFPYNYKNNLKIPIRNSLSYVCKYYAHFGGYIRTDFVGQKQHLEEFFKVKDYIKQNKEI